MRLFDHFFPTYARPFFNLQGESKLNFLVI